MSTKIGRRVRTTTLLLVASFVAAHLSFVLLPKVFEPWNAQTIDQLFMFRSNIERLRPAYDETVVHVDISNTTIQQLNNFYLNRSHYAQVIRNLGAMHTAAQVYDFIFAARTNEKDDQKMIDATRDTGNVYYGLAFALSGKEAQPQRKQPRNEDVLRYLSATMWSVTKGPESDLLYKGDYPLLTFPDLSYAARGSGFLSLKSDSDGVFRRAPLLVHYNGAFYPSLPFRVVCDYLGVTPEKVVIDPGKSVTLKDARRPGGTLHDVVIPIDSNGNIVIDFIGPWERMKHYNFADILRASEDRDDLDMLSEELSGKIVLISDVSTGATDVGPVPTDVSFPLSGLHANVIHTILTESFFRELSNLEMILIELLLMAIISLMSLRFSSLTFTFGNIALALAYIACASLFFFYGHIIFQIVRPLFILAFATLFVTAYRYFNEEKEKAVLRRSFEAYFPPSVVKKIMANPEVITAAGQKKELTVLFSDIKSFTTYSSEMTPDQIQKRLNEYFEAMVEIVFRHEGTVDKYIGDGLMVFFGDPEPQPDHALRCVLAAVDMQKKVRELKEKWQKEGAFPIRIRVGINTGEVVVGNMGSARHLSYTVLGSAVNLAQRLESNAPVEGIMISQRTYDLVKDHVPTRSLGQIQVKGIEAPISVYEVLVEPEPAG